MSPNILQLTCSRYVINHIEGQRTCGQIPSLMIHINSFVRRISLLSGFGLLMAAAACGDGPTGVGGNELLGTLHLPADQAGVVLELSPAHVIDSIRVGPSASSPNAYLVVLGRDAGDTAHALVLAPDNAALGTVVRMRLFLAKGSDRHSVAGHVVERSDMAGGVHAGRDATQIVWER